MNYINEYFINEYFINYINEYFINEYLNIYLFLLF